MGKTLPFSCPVCGRVTDYPIRVLIEGAHLDCPFCKVSIKLHGHMLAYVKRRLTKIGAKRPSFPLPNRPSGAKPAIAVIGGPAFPKINAPVNV